MGVLVIIMGIVLVYIMYKQDKQDRLRKQKEAQEATVRLNFEQELKQKATQWVNTPFFMKLANCVIIDINKCIKSALTAKISENECDSLSIQCHESYIKVWNYGRLNYFEHKTAYRELGFEDLDSSSTTAASLNLALLSYLQTKYQTMPEIVFSFSVYNSITEHIFIHDGQVKCYLPNIHCDITKMHPLLEKITIP